MKTAALLLLFVSAALANPLQPSPRPTCSADNCARAVTGTLAKPASTIRKSDCSSFMMTTVTPPPATTTVTIQGTAPAGQQQQQPQQQGAVTVAPTAVPTYASSCNGSARYSSACSCYGITATTSYAPQATVTTTVYGPPTCYENYQAQDPSPSARNCRFLRNCNTYMPDSQAGYLLGSVNAASAYDCINACDSNQNCVYGEYDKVSLCRLYSQVQYYNNDPTQSHDVYVLNGNCQGPSQSPS